MSHTWDELAIPIGVLKNPAGERFVCIDTRYMLSWQNAREMGIEILMAAEDLRAMEETDE